MSLETRRELLTEALSTVGDPIRLSESFETAPADLIRAAKEQSLEGIVVKRKDPIYEPGKRSDAWLKYRINRGQEFVIGGHTPDHPFDALIVGYYKGSELNRHHDLWLSDRAKRTPQEKFRNLRS